MQTLTQSPVREVGRQYQKVVDGVWRDEIAPYRVRRGEYLNCCQFSNEVEKYGIKPSAIAALENGNRGFRLSINSSDSGSEYEVEVRGGHARLGVVNTPRTTRTLLAQGSASQESTWTQFAAIIKRQEGKRNSYREC